MSYGDFRQPGGEHVPLVGRPRGAAWRALQADGVVWEGQVFLVGDEADLAARMIVTHRRVSFARGGIIVLDLAREWLRPAPILRRDGTILLSITPPGTSYDVESETIPLRMRDGHPAAGQVIAMLAGSGARRILPDAVSGTDFVRAELPPLPDFRQAKPVPKTEAEPTLNDFPLLPTRLDDDLPFGSFEFQEPRPRTSSLPSSVLPPSEPPPDHDTVVRPTPPPVSSHRDRSWNLEPQVRQMMPSRTPRRRRGWVFRIGGLVVLLAFSALLGADRIPLPSIDSLNFDPSGAGPTATAPSTAQFVPPTTTAGETSTELADTADFALGIGSEGRLVPTPTGNNAPAAQDATEPAATEAPPATEGPAATEPAVIGATEPAAEPTEAPEDTATEEPATTEEPAAAEPTATTEAPAATTETAATATPAESAGPLQLTVAQANRGATLPEYGLTPPNEGEWLVVMLELTNQTDENVELTLEDFVLTVDGTDLAVDRRSTVVATILRLPGAPDSLTDTVRVEPDEPLTLPLVFQVPVEATDLTLRYGDVELNLSSDLAVNGAST